MFLSYLLDFTKLSKSIFKFYPTANINVECSKTTNEKKMLVTYPV